MIKIIAAVSMNGIIGLDNKLPWNYPADMRHFRERTKNSTVIMGRRTFDSMKKALPNRRNIVISSRAVDASNVETFSSIEAALRNIDEPIPAVGCSCPTRNAETGCDHIPPVKPIWLIGGAGIYEEGMNFAQEIHLTLVPDVVSGSGAVRFPFINPRLFEANPLQFIPGGEDQDLLYAVYEKRIDV